MAMIGEIKLWAGTYAPQGWAFCAGQLLSISDNDYLYAMIGTTYGGDGSSSFALPDLRGRVPMHSGPTNPAGLQTGSERVTLLTAQLPRHGHAVAAAAAATGGNPANSVWAAIASEESAPYSTGAANAVMAESCIGPAGGGASHENMMPYQVLNYIIALEQNGDDTPYLSEVRAFAFGRIPKGWVACDGSLLAIPQNTALFSLIGNYFGGNAVSNFAVPNLVGRVPVGAGNGPGLTPRVLGKTGGAEQVTLLPEELAVHNHLPGCSGTAGNSVTPINALWAADPAEVAKYAASPGAAMSPGAIGGTGGNAAHENRQPFLAISYAIAREGIFPPRG